MRSGSGVFSNELGRNSIHTTMDLPGQDNLSRRGTQDKRTRSSSQGRCVSTRDRFLLARISNCAATCNCRVMSKLVEMTEDYHARAIARPEQGVSSYAKISYSVSNPLVDESFSVPFSPMKCC